VTKLLPHGPSDIYEEATDASDNHFDNNISDDNDDDDSDDVLIITSYPDDNDDDDKVILPLSDDDADNDRGIVSVNRPADHHLSNSDIRPRYKTLIEQKNYPINCSIV
jgi:hypothetical protein